MMASIPELLLSNISLAGHLFPHWGLCYLLRGPANMTVKARLSPTPHLFIFGAFLKTLWGLPFALMVLGFAPACVAQIGDIRGLGIRNGTLWGFAGIAALCGSRLGGTLVADEGGSFTYLHVFTGVVILVGAAGWLAAMWSMGGWEICVKV